MIQAARTIPRAHAPHDFIHQLHAAAARIAREGLSIEDVTAAAGLAQFLPGVFAAAYDRVGRYVWLSDSFRSLLSVEPSSLVGRVIDEFLPEVWCEERRGIIRRALDANVAVTTIEIFRGRRVESLVLPAPAAAPEPMVLYIGRFGLGLTTPPGNPPVAGILAPTLLEQADWGPLGVLTRRELEVLRLIARGQENPAIAVSIHRTKRAVEWHIQNLYTLLHCNNRMELFRLGFQAGLPDIDDEHWDRMVSKVRADRDHADASGEA